MGSRALEWGKGRRPKATSGIGTPRRSEGSNGDIQVRSTNLGAKLFAKVSGMWHNTPLSLGETMRIGTSVKNHLSIDGDSVDIYSGNVKVASFGETTSIKDLNLDGKIVLTSTVVGDSGSKNVVIGVGNSSEGNQNVVIGAFSAPLLSTVAGSPTPLNNVIIGTSAATAMTTGGTGNVVIGGGAGQRLTGANPDYNTLVGVSSGTYITSGNSNVCLGRNCGTSLVDCTNSICIGHFAGWLNSNNDTSICIGTYNQATGDNAIAIGSSIAAAANETVIGVKGVFRFVSKQYSCDIADNEDTKSASTDDSPIKLPAYSIIKSISVVVERLSNLGTYNVALYHSTDAGAVADDTALGGTPVEILGAGIAATMSGDSASAVDIALGSGTIEKQTYFMDEGISVDAVARYIHVGNAGAGNGVANPSTTGLINVLVEYIALD